MSFAIIKSVNPYTVLDFTSIFTQNVPVITTNQTVECVSFTPESYTPYNLSIPNPADARNCMITLIFGDGSFVGNTLYISTPNGSYINGDTSYVINPGNNIGMTTLFSNGNYWTASPSSGNLTTTKKKPVIVKEEEKK